MKKLSIVLVAVLALAACSAKAPVPSESSVSASASPSTTWTPTRSGSTASSTSATMRPSPIATATEVEAPRAKILALVTKGKLAVANAVIDAGIDCISDYAEAKCSGYLMLITSSGNLLAYDLWGAVTPGSDSFIGAPPADMKKLIDSTFAHGTKLQPLYDEWDKCIKSGKLRCSSEEYQAELLLLLDDLKEWEKIKA